MYHQKDPYQNKVIKGANKRDTIRIFWWSSENACIGLSCLIKMKLFLLRSNDLHKQWSNLQNISQHCWPAQELKVYIAKILVVNIITFLKKNQKCGLNSHFIKVKRTNTDFAMNSKFTPRNESTDALLHVEIYKIKNVSLIIFIFIYM